MYTIIHALISLFKRFKKHPRFDVLGGPHNGDTVILPGFGMMDGDFTAHIDRESLTHVHVSMGILGRWWQRDQFHLDGDRWVHKDVA